MKITVNKESKEVKWGGVVSIGGKRKTLMKNLGDATVAEIKAIAIADENVLKHLEGDGLKNLKPDTDKDLASGV